MSEFGTRFSGSHEAGLPPFTYEDHAAAETLALAETSLDYVQFGAAVDSFVMEDAYSMAGTSIFIDDTLAVEDLGGVLGSMSNEEDVLLGDLGFSWVTIGSSMPVDAVSLADSFSFRSPFGFSEVLAVEDEGGLIGTFSVDEALSIVDASSNRIINGSNPRDTLTLSESITIGAPVLAEPSLAVSDEGGFIGAMAIEDTLGLVDVAVIWANSDATVVSPVNDTLATTHGTAAWSGQVAQADALAIAEAALEVAGIGRADNTTLADSFG